jgi:hypothetical protein
MPAIDLTLLRPGVRVKLRGDAKPQPNKPYPKGWQTVAEVEGYPNMEPDAINTAIRVESDLRWLPVSLIEEIAP